MKRPTLEYAENCTLIHTYARKLEEYCDELEKAMRVMDEIQKRTEYLCHKAFQMPQDEDVEV